MKKFVFIFFGYEPPTPEIKEAWGSWFASIGDKMVDNGNPFWAGREIGHDGTTELTADKRGAAGYCIINAKNMDEAEKIAQGCPIITSVQIYEALSM